MKLVFHEISQKLPFQGNNERAESLRFGSFFILIPLRNGKKGVNVYSD